MKKTLIQPVKGTRDFYPEQMALRSWLYNTIRTVSESFGYQEYEAPILETIDLYAAKSGEELVNEQAFVLTDRGGDELAMRPELTPSLARMVAQRQNQLGRPIRWWSFGPFWRYERPQKGRTREFFQWNIDLIGTESILADAEIATISAEFFRRAGLSPQEVKIQVNSRRLMNARLQKIDIGDEMRTSVFRVIDKREKLRPADWEAYAAEQGLSSAQIAELKAMLDNRQLWRESGELVTFFEAIKDLGAGDYIEFEPSIVRGLDYYTGIVFEARDYGGKFRAILGGGRYDNLVTDVGGDPLPGVGFAMGDVVISLMLEEYGRLPKLSNSPTQVLVTAFDESTLPATRRLASQLRQAGLNVDLYPEAAKLNKQLKYADRQGIPFAVILGPDEVKAGTVVLRNMLANEQQVVSQSELAARISRNRVSLRNSVSEERI
jgi:histidyl-tRNA synthetase